MNDWNSLCREYIKLFERGDENDYDIDDPTSHPSARFSVDSMSAEEFATVIGEGRMDRVNEFGLKCFGKQFDPYNKSCRKCGEAMNCQKEDPEWKEKAILDRNYNPDKLLEELDAYDPPEKVDVTDDGRDVAVIMGYPELAEVWPNGFYMDDVIWCMVAPIRIYLSRMVGDGFFTKFFIRAQCECLKRKGFGGKRYEISPKDVEKALSTNTKKTFYPIPLSLPRTRKTIAEKLEIGTLREGDPQFLISHRMAVKKAWDKYRKEEIHLRLLCQNGYNDLKLKSNNHKGKRYCIELRPEGILLTGWEDIETETFHAYNKDERTLHATLGAVVNECLESNQKMSGKRFFKIGKWAPKGAIAALKKR